MNLDRTTREEMLAMTHAELANLLRAYDGDDTEDLSDDSLAMIRFAYELLGWEEAL